jgi:CheY-like chemotaxis protein
MSKKILAIDDSLALRMFISKTLAQSPEEFTVVTAKDGGEGIHLAQSGTPDLILLDYILPDMKGDAVCQKLVADPTTAAIPVVMMSSNAGDIKRAEAEYKNIVKAIAKPFTPDLLTATVRFVIRSQQDSAPVVTVAAAAAAKPVTPKTEAPKAVEPTKPTTAADAALVTAARQILFSGRSDLFPIYRAFTAAQQAELTGALRMQIGQTSICTYFQTGRPVITTSRDADAYMVNSTFQSTVKQAGALDGAMKRMRETAVPVFVTLGEQQLLDDDKLQLACREHGARLLARAWTEGRFQFEFEQLEHLPDLCGPLKPVTSGMDEWMLESLRNVGDDALSAIAWGDLGGVPIYTRHGYERIQHITLTREEANFLSHIGTSTLAEIAVAMKATPERAQEILFRFLSLEIFEYWPAAILRGEV